MKIVRFPSKINNKKRNLILGSFASFHNGHLQLLNKAKEYKENVAIILIENPDSLPSLHKKEYESLEIRLQNLSNIGIDEAIIINFNSKIQNLEGNSFAKILQKTYNVKKFIVGEDFKMGKNASYYSKDFAKDFDVEIVKSKKIKNNKISTKLLREIIELGDVALIKELTPFYFSINIKVNPNNEFHIEQNLKPHKGIYSSWAIINDIQYWSIVLIGFTKNKIIIPDLFIKNKKYDCQIKFCKKIRSIIKEKDEIISKKDIKDCNFSLIKLNNNNNNNI